MNNEEVMAKILNWAQTGFYLRPNDHVEGPNYLTPFLNQLGLIGSFYKILIILFEKIRSKSLKLNKTPLLKVLILFELKNVQ